VSGCTWLATMSVGRTAQLWRRSTVCAVLLVFHPASSLMAPRISTIRQRDRMPRRRRRTTTGASCGELHAGYVRARRAGAGRGARGGRTVRQGELGRIQIAVKCIHGVVNGARHSGTQMLRTCDSRPLDKARHVLYVESMTTRTNAANGSTGREEKAMKAYQYFAVARNKDGEVELMRVVYRRKIAAEYWRGVTYADDKAARAALWQINAVWQLARPLDAVPATLPAHVVAAIGQDCASVNRIVGA